MAYYLVLTCLAHFSRLDLKSDVVSKGNILNLLENYEDLSSCFDNFLNGKFELLAQQVNKIHEDLCMDMFFVDNTIYKLIRNKNLQ